MSESEQAKRRVVVNRQVFLKEVSFLVEELMDSVEGVGVDGVYDRVLMCDLVDRAGLRGDNGVLELLIYDLVRIPVCSAPDGEPLWYLTLTLNAAVSKEVNG